MLVCFLLKRTSGHLNSKGFLRVFLMTRATKKEQATTDEFENKFNEHTALFNNMRTPTFKAQPTNAFFATVDQVFGDSSKLPTTVERAVIKSLSNIQITKQCSAVAGS